MDWDATKGEKYWIIIFCLTHLVLLCDVFPIFFGLAVPSPCPELQRLRKLHLALIPTLQQGHLAIVDVCTLVYRFCDVQGCRHLLAGMKVKVTSPIGSFHSLLKGNQAGKLPEVRPGLARLLKAHLRKVTMVILLWSWHLQVGCLQRPVNGCVDELQKLCSPDQTKVVIASLTFFCLPSQALVACCCEVASRVGEPVHCVIQ